MKPSIHLSKQTQMLKDFLRPTHWGQGSSCPIKGTAVGASGLDYRKTEIAVPERLLHHFRADA